MREKIKSVILFILVIISLFLTSLLNFYNFNDRTVPLLEYYPQIKFGDNIEVLQYLKPTEFIIHFGDNTHTIIKSDNNQYEILDSAIRDWTFYNIEVEKSIIKWDDLIKNIEGVEVIFSNPLTFNELINVFEFDNTNYNFENINRLWIYDEKGSIKAYFISDSLDEVYYSNVLITDELLKNYIVDANSEVTYSFFKSSLNSEGKLVQQMYYLPNEGIDIVRVKETYTILSETDLIQMLFINPSAAKNVYEQSQKKIVLYTDGINSLQHNIIEKDISYYQPVLDYTDQFDLGKDINAAIKFVNQHGGWDGEYILENVERNYDEERTEIVFRKYVNGIPLYEEKGIYGLIKMKVFDGFVSLFQRSIILIDKSENEEGKSLSGKEIINIVDGNGLSASDIETIKLIYKVEKVKDLLVLEPYWLIETGDNKNIEILAWSE